MVYLYSLRSTTKEGRTIHIGILTTTVKKEEQELVRAAKEKGHKTTILEVNKCSLSVCPDEARIFYKSKDITHEFDLIIPRVDISHSNYAFNVLRQFQAIDVYTTDTAYSLELGRDKLQCLQYLLKKNIPFPTTGIAYVAKDFDNMIEAVGGAPLIIKLIEGTEGIGVFLAEDDKQAMNLLKTFKQLKTPILVQKFIAESSGTDLRCFVVGNKVVASMERKSQNGDFRANVALGGHSVPAKITPEENDVVLNAAKAINLNIAGVDLIRSEHGPLVIEINVAADFIGEHNVTTVCKEDVAGHIIDYALAGKAKHNKGEGVWLNG